MDDSKTRRENQEALQVNTQECFSSIPRLPKRSENGKNNNGWNRRAN